MQPLKRQTMLCELAHSFPNLIAQILERDRGRTRNFREETVTDLLMASLVGLEPFGIRVDFPDEPSTGGDMEWVFVAPKGGRYLRLIIQAKRSQFWKLKAGGYWYYRELAHGAPPGDQAQTLIKHASSSGSSTLPLYIFYHPTSACAPATGGEPAIEGANLVLASHVAPIVKGGCSRAEKKVEFWRSKFMPLSEILCWPTNVAARRGRGAEGATLFLAGSRTRIVPDLVGGFHPDLVATRLRRRLPQVAAAESPDAEPTIKIEPSEEIPAEILRAIRGEATKRDRERLKRPRVIFSTSLQRDTEAFRRVNQVI